MCIVSHWNIGLLDLTLDSLKTTVTSTITHICLFSGEMAQIKRVAKTEFPGSADNLET